MRGCTRKVVLKYGAEAELSTGLLLLHHPLSSPFTHRDIPSSSLYPPVSVFSLSAAKSKVFQGCLSLLAACAPFAAWTQAHMHLFPGH